MTFGDEVRAETLKNNYMLKEVEEWYPVWSEKNVPNIKKMILSRAKMGDTIRSIDGIPLDIPNFSPCIDGELRFLVEETSEKCAPYVSNLEKRLSKELDLDVKASLFFRKYTPFVSIVFSWN
jgi:hypothetical protein